MPHRPEMMPTGMSLFVDTLSLVTVHIEKIFIYVSQAYMIQLFWLF